MIHGIQTIDHPNVPFPMGVERRRSAGRPQVENRGPIPEDRVEISEEASRLSGAEDEKKTGAAKKGELTEADESRIRELKRRDQEVKAHESAHMSAGAGLVRGGANYSYTKGPDGIMYATGGEVSIDSSAENSPEATIRKMQQVRRAAMAPAEPSGQDVKVAASAARSEMKARVEMAKENLEKMKDSDETEGGGEKGPGEVNGAQGRGPDEANGARGRGPGEANGAQGPGRMNGAQGYGPGMANGPRGSAPNRIGGMAGNEPDGVNRLPGRGPGRESGLPGSGSNIISGLPEMYGRNGDRNNFSAGALGGRINMAA